MSIIERVMAVICLSFIFSMLYHVYYKGFRDYFRSKKLTTKFYGPAPTQQRATRKKKEVKNV